MAIDVGRVDIVRLLIARHADVGVRVFGETLMSRALLYDRPQTAAIVRLLKAAGAKE